MAAPVLQFKRGQHSNVGLASFRAGEPGFTTDKYDFYIGLDGTAANQKFFGSARYWLRENGTNAAQVKLVDKNGTNYIGIAASDTLSGIATYRLPNTTNGSTGDFLKLKSASGGFYDLEWAAVPSGSFSITGDTGSDTFTTGETLTFTGGTNLNSAITNNTVTFNLDDNISITNLNATGITTLAGNITLGDNTSDDITVGGEFVSSLNPSTSGNYDLGTSSQRWRNAWFSGNVNVAGIITATSYSDLLIANKDIVMAYIDGVTETDTTANHGGVAVASTEGTPLFDISVAGINTLPKTYKQIMWVKKNTFTGLATDAWMFNYGVAIGTSTMGNGVRLAVGSGVSITDTEVYATTFRGALVGNVTGNASSADQVKTVTASDTNATYYLTFVDANNGSATNESVYTDDGIYYNPGTNRFTTQHATFTGDVTVQGTLTGTATTATRATLVDTTSTSTNADYYVTFVDTLAGQNGETLRVGTGLSINPSTGNVGVSSILSVGSASATNAYIKAGGGSNALYLYSNGDVSFQAKAIVNEIRSSSNSSTLITLSGLDATFAQDVKVTGITSTGTLKLSGTSGIGITGISTSTTLAENSDAYLPTQKAVKAYVDAVDLTLGINADSGGPSTVATSQTLVISGTTGEVNTSVSGQTITVGLPDTVNITTLLDVPTIEVTNVKAKDGTSAITITDSTGAVSCAQNLTVQGNLYVNGSTTQVNTTTTTIEDQLLELGIVDGSAPSSDLDKDIGVLLNYYTGSAKKAAMFWDDSASRIVFADDVTESSGVLTVASNAYASIEIEALWVNDCAGQSQVISCSGSTRSLENITIDAGTF